MNSKVRCAGCKRYRSRDGMQKVGLGFICGHTCLELVREKAREKNSNRKRQRVVANSPNGAIKKRVRRRDGEVCRWCGRNNMLEVHHIEYLSQGGANSVNNLITLCEAHHRQAHSIKWYWQPILRATIWRTYEGCMMTVPEVEEYVKRKGWM